ncbi:unnamed protein product [Eruca vesicaria subsp. sativa]|uniref:Uncharacterized protein n=1 Tax=Eruca vesicaria subsp. sativa TaxID=29727 RepID=A0ABC8KKX4_ERUVS|nr:unnamed protein product [Eruca vesicaria subsp. sativa]
MSWNSVSAITLVRLASIVAGEKANSYLTTAHCLLQAVLELRLKELAVAVPPLMCCAADMISGNKLCWLVLSLLQSVDFSSDPRPSISKGAQDLVQKMLVRAPQRRLTAHQVLCKSFKSKHSS